jgi:hypothetical protein
MTADTYDDGVALRVYVLKYFRHLMTPLERRVTEYTAPIVSDAKDSKIRSLYTFLENRDGHVDDEAVLRAFQTPYDERVANAVDHLLEMRRDEVLENRCKKCHRLARTPVAQQCLWCGHDWH